jgi:CheY-like chemotaxis protein
MIVALVCTARALDELRETVLFRRNVERRMAHNIAQARAQAAASPPDIIVVDHQLPEAPRLVSELREDPLTRKVSIAVLAHGDFDTADVALLEAGANAILRLPPGPDWDDRLARLIHIPVRREARLPMHLQIAATFGSWGDTFSATLLNLSIHGLLLLSSRPLRIGDDVHFAFQLPDQGGLVNGTGTVIRQVGSEQYGVELTHVDGEGRRSIRRFVEAESSPS